MSTHDWKEKIGKYAQAGNITECIKLAHVLAKKKPNEVADYVVGLGIFLSKERLRHGDALSLFEAASDIATEKVHREYANFNAGICLTLVGSSFAEKGQIKKAERCFEKAVTLNPDFSLAHQSYGRCLHLLGKKKMAEIQFKQALRLDPKDASTHAFFAILLQNLKRLPETLTHLKQALELEPENSNFHALLGMALMEGDTLDEAKNEFNKAIDLNPSNSLARYHYGRLLARISRWSEAEIQFEKVFDVDPSYLNVKELYAASILHEHASRPRQPITEKWGWARGVYFAGERPLDVKEFELIEKHKKDWKIMYDAFTCERCGRCCRSTKWVVNLDSRLCWEDIERWRREGRSDILQHVMVFEGLGGDLIGPAGKFFSQCPFMKKEEDRKYSCLIHETKPKVCEVAPFYFHSQQECENCGQRVKKKDVYCKNCGMFLQVDPHALLNGCPGLTKALKASGFYKPFHKLSILDLFSRARDPTGSQANK